jgi:hypothetical protein
MEPWTIGRTSVHSPRWTMERNNGRCSLAFPCTGPRRDGAGSKRRGRGSLPWLAQDGGGAQTAERWWTEVAARVPRREGTRGAEVRKGGERWARCGDAETGVHFIVVGRQDGRPSDGRRCTIKALITRWGDDEAAMTHGETEEESVACRFSSIWVWMGIHRRQVGRRLQPWAAGCPSAGGGRHLVWTRVRPSALGPMADGAGFSGR